MNSIEEQLWHQHIIGTLHSEPEKLPNGQMSEASGIQLEGQMGSLHKYMYECMPWYNELIIPKANTRSGGVEWGRGSDMSVAHTCKHTDIYLSMQSHKATIINAHHHHQRRPRFSLSLPAFPPPKPLLLSAKKYEISSKIGNA